MRKVQALPRYEDCWVAIEYPPLSLVFIGFPQRWSFGSIRTADVCR